MSNAILGIVITAAGGSLCMPIIMLVLARLGYFEPITFVAFGRTWNFSPKAASPSRVGNALIFTFPLQRQTVFASVVTAAYTVAAPTGVLQGGIRHFETGAMLSGQIRDVRAAA